MYLASSVLVLLVCRLVDAQSPAPTAASPANIKIFPLSYDPHAAPRVCDLQASYEQEYAAVAQTASGHWYFQGVSDPSSFIYYEPDCDGEGSSGRWVLDDDAPSTTRAYDLDNDGDCHYSADLNSCANGQPLRAGSFSCTITTGTSFVARTTRNSWARRSPASPTNVSAFR